MTSATTLRLRQASGVCCAFALACLSVVAAQADGLEASAPTIDACFADTAAGRTDPDCLGEAARQCQAQPGGQTTIGISECLMSEHAAWDRILNREYRSLREAWVDEPTRLERLLMAQRGWLNFRDSECDLARHIYEGGTMAGIAFADCQMRLTAQRALSLRDLRRN